MWIRTSAENQRKCWAQGWMRAPSSSSRGHVGSVTWEGRLRWGEFCRFSCPATGRAWSPMFSRSNSTKDEAAPARNAWVGSQQPWPLALAPASRAIRHHTPSGKGASNRTGSSPREGTGLQAALLRQRRRNRRPSTVAPAPGRTSSRVEASAECPCRATPEPPRLRGEKARVLPHSCPCLERRRAREPDKACAVSWLALFQCVHHHGALTSERHSLQSRCTHPPLHATRRRPPDPAGTSPPRLRAALSATRS